MRKLLKGKTRKWLFCSCGHKQAFKDSLMIKTGISKQFLAKEIF